MSATVTETIEKKNAQSHQKMYLVEWLKRGCKPYKRNIDIVPSTWVKSERIRYKSYIFYYFPPKELWKDLDKLTIQADPAPEDWETYKCKVVGEAGNFSIKTIHSNIF